MIKKYFSACNLHPELQIQYQDGVFLSAKSKSDVYICLLEPETLYNPENRFFRITRVSELNKQKINFCGSITDQF